LIVFLTTADTETQALAAAIRRLPEDFAPVRARNPNDLQSAAALDRFVADDLSQARALVVRVPLPNNPTDLHYVGVTSDKVDCSKLPKTPVARCVEQQNPSTSVSRSK